MKKLNYIVMFAAVAAAALVSCQKAAEKEADVVVGEGIKVTLTTNGVTKTFIDGTTPYWLSTDAVGVFTGTNTVNEKFTNTQNAGEYAEFVGSVPAAGTYYAYYPYQYKVASADGVEHKIPEIQYPTPYSFDGAADILLSESFDIATTGDETIEAVRFRRLGGFIKFSFADGTTGSMLNGEHTTQVTVVVYNADESKRPCPSIKITPEGIGTVGAGMKTIKAMYDPDVYAITADGQATWFGVLPQTFTTGTIFDITISTEHYKISRIITLTSDATLGAGEILPINITLKDADVTAKTVSITNVWVKYSEGATAWNEYYGGTGGTDRNIAMDDEYVYIAESSATAKLWAISITNPETVIAVNVDGVSGGTHALCCPRILPNTDLSINGGKDILICGNLTRGGEEPKLYFWKDGIDNPPTAMTMITNATGAWYGDTFTVYGSLQDGILFYDKIGGDNVNGIVTFDLIGAITEKNYLHKRIDFNTAYYNFYNPARAHEGVCAYYPFPGDVNKGIYSPGRGLSRRGMSSSFVGDLKSDGNSAYTPTLAELGYAEGRNGFVLGYNYVEWNGKRYVIYGKQESNTVGKVYILEGSATAEWLTIANTADVKFRRDLARLDGCSLVSDNGGMDVTARIINGDLYIAAQKQNIACGVFKVSLE